MTTNSKETTKTTTTTTLLNPFTPRKGRTLQWRNVQMTVDEKASKGDDKTETEKRIILDNVWGQVPAGETTAVLGPSGSGKSSLLNVLSGRVMSGQNDKSLHVDADVRVNHVTVDPTRQRVRKSIAFVAQDDSLQTTATVREALLFSARLRLNRDYTTDDLETLVHDMIVQLGLTACADTVVDRVSGGERKRTSVGVELVTQPRLVFLDEPTSGLDSYSALQLCKVLQKVAAAGSSVLFTIHQPSSELFKMFHHAIIMKRGRVLYGGPVTALEPYMEARGFPLPPQHNLADWVLQVAQEQSTEELQAAGFFATSPSKHDGGNEDDDDWWGPEAEGSPEEDKKENGDMNPVTMNRLGWSGQTGLLFQREVTNFRRNKHALKARTAMTCAISVFIGVLFFDVAESDFTEFINIQSSFGALLMSLLANVFATTLPSLLVFPSERPVFLREYGTDHYTVLAYFLSRLAMEFIVTAVQVTISSIITYFCVGFEGNFGTYYLVIYAIAMASTAIGVLLGSTAEDPHTAMEMLPGTILPQILFSGFFVPPRLMPDWLAWVRYLCPLTYAVKIAIDNEFGGDRCSSDVEPNPCDQIMDNVDVDSDEIWWNWVVLVGMFVVFRFMALINLQRKAHKF